MLYLCYTYYKICYNILIKLHDIKCYSNLIYYLFYGLCFLDEENMKRLYQENLFSIQRKYSFKMINYPEMNSFTSYKI